MNYKLSKIYKLNSKEILLNISFNCDEYNFYINEKNIRYLDKSLKKESICEAIKYWKSHEEYNKTKTKREININSLYSILNNYGIKYHFIGKYLINVTYKDNSYIIDLINYGQTTDKLRLNVSFILVGTIGPLLLQKLTLCPLLPWAPVTR